MKTIAAWLRRREDPVELLSTLNAMVLKRFWNNPNISVRTKANPLTSEFYIGDSLVLWVGCESNTLIVVDPINDIAAGGFDGPEAFVFVETFLELSENEHCNT